MPLGSPKKCEGRPLRVETSFTIDRIRSLPASTGLLANLQRALQNLYWPPPP